MSARREESMDIAQFVMAGVGFQNCANHETAKAGVDLEGCFKAHL